MSRANPQIWRMADYLFQAFERFPIGRFRFQRAREGIRNFYYDRAAELLKKINNNEFTGKDNHSD